MTTITISLPESLKAFVDAQLATRGFGNVSEYFRSLLREAQAKEQEARLETLLLEGVASKRIKLDADFRRGLNRLGSFHDCAGCTANAREPAQLYQVGVMTCTVGNQPRRRRSRVLKPPTARMRG